MKQQSTFQITGRGKQAGRHSSEPHGLYRTGMLVIILAFALSPCARAEQFFVSPSGSDLTGNGTINNPWGTITFALNDLQPGDTLFLRGGTYYESGIPVYLKGEAGSPIRISSYPGEQAVIDGAEPDYSTEPNNDWEVVDAQLHLYRTTRSYTGSFAGAWLLDYDTNLVQYSSAANMDSLNYGPLNGSAPLYIGPGLQLRGDGHIYIRLQLNPNDQTDHNGNPLPPLPGNPNPQLNRIAIYLASQLVMTSGAEYVIFDGIDFRHASTIMDLRDNSSNLIIRNCSFQQGRYGVLVRSASNCTITRCDFNNGLPHYVYWTDVKGGEGDVAEAIPEFQSLAITGNLSDFTISNCTIRNIFDGVMMHEGTTGARLMNNTFHNTRDDAIDVMRSVWDVEIGYNMLHRTMLGISILPHDEEGGEVYIHHNIIDTTGYHHSGRAGSWREDRYPVWSAGTIFGTHDQGCTLGKWKVYNNTFVARKGRLPHFAFGLNVVQDSVHKQVRNNIFFALDDRVCCDGEQATDGTEYNGNVFWQNAPATLPLFHKWGNDGDYYSLAEFRDQSNTDWETVGLEINPGFDVAAIDEGTFDTLTMLERYRPTNGAIFKEGILYDDAPWPCTSNVTYRGALGPRQLQRRNHQIPPE